MLNESLSPQMLKDLKEIARQLGATSMGNLPIQGTSVNIQSFLTLLNSVNSDSTLFNGNANYTKSALTGSTLHNRIYSILSRIQTLE